jgi:hypothetical protein
VRVFLRSEEKKRDNVKLKEAKEQAASAEETAPSSEPAEKDAPPEAEAVTESAVPVASGEVQDDAEPISNEEVAKDEEVGNGVANGVQEVRFPFRVYHERGCLDDSPIIRSFQASNADSFATLD